MAIIENPEGSLARALRTSLPQLGASIAQQLQTRRQQQNNALGLMGLFPNVDPKQLQLAAGMSPDMLKTVLQLGGMSSPQRLTQEAESPEVTQQRNVSSQEDQVAALVDAINNTPASALARNEIMQPKQPKTKVASVKQVPQQPKQPMSFLEALSNTSKPMTAYQKAQLEANKEALDFRKKESDEIRNEKSAAATADYRKQVYDQEYAAISSDMRLGRLWELAKEDKLVNPLIYSMLSGMGINATPLMSEESQEFDELITNFLRDAKSVFGSRVTNYEMSTFIKSIPSLRNTKEGKMRIIRNLKIYNAASKLRAKTVRDIIKENNKKVPTLLREEVDERIGDKLDKLSKMFWKGKNA